MKKKKKNVLFTSEVNNLNKYQFVTVANTIMNSISREENGFKILTISFENFGCFLCSISPINKGGNKATAKEATFRYGTTIAPLSNMVRPRVNVQNGIVTGNK